MSIVGAGECNAGAIAVPSIRIPRTNYAEFCKSVECSKENGTASDHWRLGQHFHTYFRLERVTSEGNKAYLDSIYNAQDDVAQKLIDAIVDWVQ